MADRHGIVRPKGIDYLRILADNHRAAAGAVDDIFVQVCTVETENHALSRAVSLGSIRLVRTLIEGGADVNSRNVDLQTAVIVFCARKEGRPPLDLLDYLLSCGADTNLQDRYGKTALMYACGVQQEPEVVNRLLNSGADVFLEDHIGFSALTYVYNSQNQALIQLLSHHCQKLGRQMVVLETRLNANFMSYLKIQKLVGAARSSVAIDKQIPVASVAAGGELRQVRRLSAVSDKISKILNNSPLRKKSSSAALSSTDLSFTFRHRSKSMENAMLKVHSPSPRSSRSASRPDVFDYGVKPKTTAGQIDPARTIKCPSCGYGPLRGTKNQAVQCSDVSAEIEEILDNMPKIFVTLPDMDSGENSPSSTSDPRS